MKIIIKDIAVTVLLAAFGGWINTLAGKPKREKYSWGRTLQRLR